MRRTNTLLPIREGRRIKHADPIHPNAGVGAWYEAQLTELLRRMYVDARAMVGKVYAPVVMATDARSPALFLQKTMGKWAEQWVSKFDTMSARLAERFANRAYGATQKSMQASFRRAGWTVEFTPTPLSVEAYRATIAENINLIKSIPQQFLKDVQSQVWASAMKGGDLHELSANIKAKYGVSAKRAALIARDQNAKAKAVIERTRRQELGITHAIWQHSSGGKEPRPTHVAESGKRYDIRTGWYDPDANGPGKGEYVWPGELINCRCTSRAILPFE